MKFRRCADIEKALKSRTAKKQKPKGFTMCKSTKKRKIVNLGKGPENCEPLTETEKGATHWNKNKASSVDISELYGDVGDLRRSEKMKDCANVLTFTQSLIKQTGEVVQRLSQVFFCKERYCTVCQWRRSLVWVARFHAALVKVRIAHPRARWVFATFTVKNCKVEGLRDTLKWMNGGWHKMSRRKGWPALGFVRTTEVTRNYETGEVHPHFHALLLVSGRYFKDDYKPHEWWVEQWKSALKIDYDPVVNIKAAKGRSGYGDAESAAVELLKYSVKPDDLLSDAGFLEELTAQTSGLRYISTGGVLKDVVKEDVSEKELRELEKKAREESEEELRELRYFYHHRSRQYWTSD